MFLFNGHLGLFDILDIHEEGKPEFLEEQYPETFDEQSKREQEDQEIMTDLLKTIYLQYSSCKIIPTLPKNVITKLLNQRFIASFKMLKLPMKYFLQTGKKIKVHEHIGFQKLNNPTEWVCSDATIFDKYIFDYFIRSHTAYLENEQRKKVSRRGR